MHLCMKRYYIFGSNKIIVKNLLVIWVTILLLFTVIFIFFVFEAYIFKHYLMQLSRDRDGQGTAVGNRLTFKKMC